MIILIIFSIMGNISSPMFDLLPYEDYTSFLTLLGASYVNNNFHIFGSSSEEPITVYLDSMDITNETENMPYFYIPPYLIKSISMDSKGTIYVNLKKNIRNIDLYGNLYHYPRFGASLADTYSDTTKGIVLISKDYVPFYRRGDISYTIERGGLSYFHRSYRDYFMPYINKKDGVYGFYGIRKGRQRLNLFLYYSLWKYQDFHIRWKYLPTHTPYYSKGGLITSASWRFIPDRSKEYFIKASYEKQEAKAYIFEDEDGDGKDDYSDNDYDGYIEENGVETDYDWGGIGHYPLTISYIYYISGYYFNNKQYQNKISQYKIHIGLNTKKWESGIKLNQWIGRYYNVKAFQPFWWIRYKYNPVELSGYIFFPFTNRFASGNIDLSLGIFHPLKEYKISKREGDTMDMKGGIKMVKKIYINIKVPSSTPLFLEISGGVIDKLPNFSYLFKYPDTTFGIPIYGNPSMFPAPNLLFIPSINIKNRYLDISGFFSIRKEYYLPLEEWRRDISGEIYKDDGWQSNMDFGVKGKISYKNNFVFFRATADSSKGNFYSNSFVALFAPPIPEFVTYNRRFQTDGGLVLSLPTIKNIHHSISGIFHYWGGSRWVQTHWDGSITKGVYPNYFRIDTRYNLSLSISRLNIGIIADVYNLLNRKNLIKEVGTEGDWDGIYDDPSVWDIPRTIYIGITIK